MRYFRKLQGERIYLSPVDPDDAEQVTKWMNDPEVAVYLGQHQNVTSLPSQQKKLEQKAESGYNFAIVLNEGDRLIGSIGLGDVNQQSRCAAFGISIGEAEHRGKGYGAEAIRLLLRYAFDTLNLRNVMLCVHADNAQGLACYRKVGFREIGRRREATFKNGAYVDVVYMDILADELS